MQNWERSKFDEDWKEAFEKAEVSPSDLVWSGLDQKLTQAEGDEMKVGRVQAHPRRSGARVATGPAAFHPPADGRSAPRTHPLDAIGISAGHGVYLGPADVREATKLRPAQCQSAH